MGIYDFGVLLKQLRTDARMKQKDLAKKLNVTEANISKYECGTATPPFETMRTIASVFNVSMDYLYGTEKKSTVSTFGLSDDQKEIIEILTQQFRVKNGFTDKKLSEEQYTLLGKIVAELVR
ncbi:MAG: helix-turn-helix transcriptional regulator [Oscillospiraceae bacterium]|nr:helix-turn-helix transcriptional regulator [Oscillospiraceae bacterium]